MHFRRAVLLFALVLGLTALATSIAPAPRRTTTQAPPAAPQPPPSGEVIAPIEFTAPPAGQPPQRTIRAGQHVIVHVSSLAPGEATMPKLGQVAAVDPNTPASFDLLPRAGSYDVIFTPSSGSQPAVVGWLVAKG